MDAAAPADDGDEITFAGLFGEPGEDGTADAASSAVGSDIHELGSDDEDGDEDGESEEEEVPPGQPEAAARAPERKRRRLQCDCCLQFSDELRMSLGRVLL